MATTRHILVINPGSTSTKVALFEDERTMAEENIRLADETAKLELWEQFAPRLQTIIDFIQNNKVATLAAVAGRGGLLKPLRRGTFLVNDAMLRDARLGLQGQHAANLGCALAHEIARQWGCDAYIVDPVCVDELTPLARYSGHPLIQRRALSHVLNIRASAIRRAAELNKDVQETRFIIAHLGGGISVAAVRGGQIIDVNDAASDGPFTPERSGSLPMQQFIDLCFSGQYSMAEMKKMIMGNGGLQAYLGTSNVSQIEAQINDGDARAREVFAAMIYQIAKEIGGMSCVLGQVDDIILTGGLTNSRLLVEQLTARIRHLAPVITYVGEFEMEALAQGVLRVLNGSENVQIYT
ncbi:butyrate kinase [candidate division KSB1 bacterium]|nr:butyrate kinase [candidate division KSB1 bacterium]RQW02797.1 MAG: butyrate kinase [candidate division KSB1 bacterium]